MSPRVYIETYGCQMNVADSELIAGVLQARGYLPADSPADADVVLINTCAIREKAEDRIFGRLGWLKPLKQARPELVLGIAGCMAEHLRDELSRRAPHLDLIVGPDGYRRLPELIEHARAGDDPLLDLRLDRDELYQGLPSLRAPGVSGYVSIMRGCDKFCSFCIVPYVRGRERSLPPGEIERQVVEMAAQGYREVVLLGQTVSGYRVEGCSFAELLRRVHAIDGIERIRFTSPYPSDFDQRLLDTLVELPRVARHLHLPAQSGSTRVLAEMRREYTAEQYLRLVRQIRAEMPDFAITTDLIVGFCGETEEDFQQTLDLAQEVEFDSAFMFKYSARSMTAAARRRPDDVSEEAKNDRLQRLIKVQEGCSRRRSAAMVGRVVEVLVEGPNPRDRSRMIGRSSCFKSTVLEADAHHHPGDLVRARVHSASTHTLFAEALAAQVPR